MIKHAIAIKNLSFAYSGKMVLQQVELHIERGEFVALLGPNGSGKSTLLKIMSTLVKPLHGEILINGHCVKQTPAKVRASLGVVFQTNPLDKLQTVRDNLTFSAALFGMTKKETENRIFALLKHFQLSDISNKYVKHLSGGMQRTVDIIRSMLHQPSILLLDEPTAGLDSAHRNQLFSHLYDLQQSNQISILFTTHQLEEAKYCSQIYQIQEGKLKVGNQNDFYSS